MNDVGATRSLVNENCSALSWLSTEMAGHSFLCCLYIFVKVKLTVPLLCVCVHSAWKGRLHNDLYCVGWDVKPYSLTHWANPSIVGSYNEYWRWFRPVLGKKRLCYQDCWHTRVIPKVSSLEILDNNIFHNLYISET